VAGVTPADILSRRAAARTWQPSRRANFGTWALAAQLSVRPLGGRKVALLGCVDTTLQQRKRSRNLGRRIRERRTRQYSWFFEHDRSFDV